VRLTSEDDVDVVTVVSGVQWDGLDLDERRELGQLFVSNTDPVGRSCG
jgi:hypothetical protein